MKIGFAMAFNQFTEPALIADAASLIEEMGAYAVWAPEHVMFFPEYASTYPYSETGRIPGDPEGLLDPFTVLTFIAARTKNLRLGTGICLVPQRNPIYTAKMVADLDYLSGGRVDFGVGIGWLKEEFVNLGMDFKSRAARCEEYIGVMKELWSPGVSEYRGQTVDLRSCYFNPKPSQKPHPPIYFGGESDAALGRVATLGDGWYAYDISPEELALRLDLLDSKMQQAGRSLDEMELIVGPNRHPVNEKTIEQYSSLGVTQLVVPLFGTALSKIEQRAAQFLR